ncbi:MAG: GNAT family N-acetyltransferase [Candidatus Nomurabacteria bacterium]|nr:GNAT family N-acetyltransferase [Candidatus Nomurabacteria bacterium]
MPVTPYDNIRRKKEIAKGHFQSKKDHEENVRDYDAIEQAKAEHFRNEFLETKSEQPLARRDFVKAVAEFLGKNLDLIYATCRGEILEEERIKGGNASLLERFGVSNDDFIQYGLNYTICDSTNGNTHRHVLLKLPDVGDNYYYYLPQQEIERSELSFLLTTKFLKETYGVEKSIFGGRDSISRRYYDKNTGEYLCENDYGMRGWNEDEHRMMPGDVQNLQNMFNTARNTLQDIAGVLEHLTDEQREIIRTNPAAQALIANAIPSDKVGNHLHFKTDKIISEFRLASDEPISDFLRFENDEHILDGIIRDAKPEEIEATGIDFSVIRHYHRPVIFASSELHDNFNERITSQARHNVGEVLVQKALEAESDEVLQAFQAKRCWRGGNSEYYYSDRDLYNFIRLVGPNVVQEVLETDDRNISEQMNSLKFLKDIGYSLERWDAEYMKRQIHNTTNITRSGVWDYVQKAHPAELPEGASEDARTNLEQRQARRNFGKAKQMYWIAKQVFYASPPDDYEDYGNSEHRKFYLNDRNVNWELYDIGSDLSDELLKKHLDKNKDLIIGIIGASANSGGNFKHLDIGSVIKALEAEIDLRNVVFARDKASYVDRLINGHHVNEKDAISDAISDWPEEWKRAISKDELDIFYEYAGEYLIKMPNGILELAEWRSKNDDKFADIKGLAVGKKSDMDFKLSFCRQPAEVQEWFSQISGLIGAEAARTYVMRFNASFESQGQANSWHDALYWAPNIAKLDAGEAKSIISGVDTVDENKELKNFLERYSRDRDTLRNSGPIPSLRELKKRVFAIESGLDISSLPPQILDITGAPGFNMSELERLSKRSDFMNLVEGRLDEKQPFEPHKRIFPSIPLEQSLLSGLGKRNENIRGAARDPKGLFDEVRGLLKDFNSTQEKPIKVQDLLRSVPRELEESLMKILQNQQVDMGPIIEAQVHAKSDPEGWVCGNYTDCCMPFGASNNTDYMFNPSTQYFTIKVGGRIVAQSVATDAIDSRDKSDVVVLDNIEVANNYKHLTPALSNAYKTFWSEYTSKPVKIGTGFSDLIPTGAILEPNSYRPKTTLSYSDASSSKIYDLPKIAGVESLDNVITFANLGARDAEIIAQMEASIYQEGAQGKAHIQDILERQRELEVPGAAASFYVRKGSEVAGYLLTLPEDSEFNDDEQVAHIYDIAVLPKYRGGALAMKMMERVFEVAGSYGMAIEAEARESTTYALLKNPRIQKWIKTKGFELVEDRLLPDYLGGEDYHMIRLENIRAQE